MVISNPDEIFAFAFQVYPEIFLLNRSDSIFFNLSTAKNILNRKKISSLASGETIYSIGFVLRVSSFSPAQFSE
jgi:hypothetical protein